MSQESRGKYLAKNTAIFAIGNMGTRLITFLMVPLYTYALSTEQYGTINTIMSICSMIIPLIMCNIGESIRRYLLDKEADVFGIQQVEVIWFAFGTIVSAILFVILLLVPGYSEYALEMSLYVFLNAFTATTLDYLRGEEKLGLYTFCGIFQTFLIALLNIVFLISLKKGIHGYFASYIIANLVCGIIAFVGGKQLTTIKRMHFDKKLFVEMSKFSIMLVPNSIMWWVTSSSDRLMVTYLISAAANGVYSVSYKLPTIMSTLNTILMQAWQYSAIKEQESKDELDYNNRMFQLYVATISIIAAGLLLINQPFTNIYVAEAYRGAWKYSPYLIFGSVFSTLGTFVGTSYYVQKDMKGNLKSATVGAAINILLNIILIPTIGVQGAAIATCISYIGVFVYRVIDTRKYLPLTIVTRFSTAITILLFIMLITSFVEGMARYCIHVLCIIGILVIARQYYIPILKGIISKFMKGAAKE
ncbi:lipopolysaccharide biosynthesis protein [Mediterraneibacter faecis]|uniref:lipopolysaccharide biosynthesis protein n=1 Tax=Mediterraneibacter faecis TaxID=592978 RepID=UPI003F954C60